MKINRRDAILQTASLTAGAYIALRSTSIFGSGPTAVDKGNPHFFLQIFVPGGLDTSYLFDARPLAMTTEKLMVNYRAKEGVIYTGTNGNSCLRTELVDPLMTHSAYFSIVNGIMMSTNFDGHEENQSYFLTGQPLGAAMLFDDISADQNSTINSVRLGGLMDGDARMTCEGMLKLTDNVGFVLTDAIKRSGEAAFAPGIIERLTHRLKRLQGEQGSRAASKAKLAQALKQVPDLKDRISKLTFPDPSKPTDGGGGIPAASSRPAHEDIKTIINLFKGQLTSAAMYVFDNTGIDTHDAGSAMRLPQTLKPIMTELAEIFRLLRETPFDDQRSMLDVTTVMFGSEFGRTMRQTRGEFAKSGTDHNPFTNTVLLAGKGIKGGMVIGASDFESVDAYKNKCSGAHKSRDDKQTHIMGKPFDFSQQAVAGDLPTEFVADHYLNIGSVINTVYDTLQIPNDKWRSLSRGAVKSPILSSLRR